MIICLKGWEKFQHYKDRDPPWVKLYRDLLTSESWVLGTDISRLVQVASVLLAARYTNKIPYRWDLIRKVASLECTEQQFDQAIAHLSSTNFLETQQDTDSASAVLASCNTTNVRVYSESESEESREEGEQRERETRARDAPRGTGVIDMGTAGTMISPAAAYSSLLEDWRRDVPECNPAAFEKWIVDLETRGKQMNPAMRLGQAKRLAGEGDFPAQLEVVEFCIEQGYKALIPLRDVRSRTRGMSRETPVEPPKRTWRPPPDEPGAKPC